MHIRTIALIPLASAAIYACSSAEEAPVTVPAGYEDVLLLGGVTDEALASFIQARNARLPADKPSQAATIDWPADGEKLQRDPPVSFCWHFGETAQIRSSPAVSDRWASLTPFAAERPAELASPLRELFGPPRPALAHGAPFSGIATYLVFSTDTDPKLVRVLTSDIAYHPSPAVWEKMSATGKPITLKIVSGFVEENRVPVGEELVAGGTIQFTISQ
jgi:hypothetical protein